MDDNRRRARFDRLPRFEAIRRRLPSVHPLPSGVRRVTRHVSRHWNDSRD